MLTPDDLSPARLSSVLSWAILGWIVGLWLNRIAYGLVAEQSVVRPRCTTCDAPIPLFQLGRRGCPSCGVALAYDRLEWLVAGLFALLAVHFGLSGQLIAYSVYTTVLALTAAMDFRHRYIYSIVSFPAIMGALILSPTLGGLDLPSTLLGFGVAFGLFLIFYLLGRLMYRDSEPVGKGDLELAAMIGAMVGFPRVLNALFLGGLVNGLVIGALLLTRRRRRTDFIPYGPGLCLGAYATFFMAP